MLHKHLFIKYLTPSILFVVGAIGGFILLFYLNGLFRIQGVQTIGVSKSESNNIQRILKGRSSIFTSDDEIKKSIHARFPTFTISSTRYILPSTLVVVIEKEKQLAYIVTDVGYLVVSKQGTVLKKERAEDIPQPAVTFYQTIHHSSYQVGQKITYSAIQRALTFITILSELGYQTETVAIDSVDMIACKTRGFVVAFSQTRGVDLQSHEVRQIIRQIKVGALQIERLDLRFDKPVVQLPKK